VDRRYLGEMGEGEGGWVPRLCGARDAGEWSNPINVDMWLRHGQPGTYDALSHLLFTPLPTAGSSGGPIIDEETGAVVGVMLGTRTVNSIEGMRGWGASAETIFEVSEQGKYAAPADEVQMFSLPGLEGKK
jgi:hypothetical protein